MLGEFVAGFVIILIGVSLFPEIVNQVAIAQNSTNLGNSSSGMVEGSIGWQVLGIVPYIFALTLIFIALLIAYRALSNAGLIDGCSVSEDTEEDKRENEQEVMEKIRQATEPPPDWVVPDFDSQGDKKTAKFDEEGKW